jgi:hypothetical protein
MCSSRAQRVGGAELAPRRRQQLAHALHQHAVAAVLQHRQRQRALEHGLQRVLVAPQRHREVLRVEG